MKLSQTTWIYPVVAGLLAGLSGCGGGGGGGGGPRAEPFGNLQATGVRVTTKTPASAHDMEMSSSIFASDPIEAVPVSYFLMNKADVDAEADDVRQYFVSSSVFENVPAGQNDYASTVQIPAEVIGGDYYLIMQVDPDDAILETDEDDNIPAKLPVRIDGTKAKLVDIVLEEAAVDTEALMLYPSDLYGNIGAVEDVVNHDFGATLQLSATGAVEAKNVDVSATITFPGNQRNPFPLWFWNSETKQYAERAMTDITPGIPSSVHLEIYIPTNNQARREIDQYLRNGGKEKFTVTFKVNELGNAPEWESGATHVTDRPDNTFTFQMVIVRPPEPPLDRIRWQRGFEKEWKNDNFGVGLGVYGEAGLDEGRAWALADADLPIKLFGKRFKLFQFATSALVKPKYNEPTESRFQLDVGVLGKVVYTRRSANPSYTWSRDWNITKTVETKKWLFVGPVPVFVAAGATGAVGFRADVFLDPALMRLSAGPYVDATAFAEASVEVLVAKVGVRGSLTLLNDTFTATAQADLSLPEPTKLQGEVSFDLTNVLQGPKGRLWVFADRRVPKFCHLILPCGIKTITDELTLASFNAFRKTDVLFKNKKTAVVDL